MRKRSAGILPYRRRGNRIEVLLVHPGGPFWARKDAGAWSIGKGEYEEGEDPFDAAMREFAEETGHRPSGPFIELAPRTQPGGKLIRAWAVDEDWDPSGFVSNPFTMQWPPRSGRMQTFPEVDRVEWFDAVVAVEKILPGQRGFIEELCLKITGQHLSSCSPAQE
jgi:predicted NUDIX family NTP pyrophosphohydrolase